MKTFIDLQISLSNGGEMRGQVIVIVDNDSARLGMLTDSMPRPGPVINTNRVLDTKLWCPASASRVIVTWGDRAKKEIISFIRHYQEMDILLIGRINRGWELISCVRHRMSLGGRMKKKKTLFTVSSVYEYPLPGSDGPEELAGGHSFIPVSLFIVYGCAVVIFL